MDKDKMNEKMEYAYFFVVGGKIVWSAESEKTLLTRRFRDDIQHDEVKEFLDLDMVPGSFKMCEENTGVLMKMVAGGYTWQHVDQEVT